MIQMNIEHTQKHVSVPEPCGTCKLIRMSVQHMGQTARCSQFQVRYVYNLDLNGARSDGRMDHRVQQMHRAGPCGQMTRV